MPIATQLESPTSVSAWLGGPEPMELVRVAHETRAFAPRLHATFTIGVVEHGAARVRHRGGVAMHRPGGVTVIEPGEVYAVEPNDGGGWGHRTLHPSTARFRRLAGLPDAAPLAPLFAAGWYADAELAERLRVVHARLERAALDPAGDDGVAERMLADVLATLVRRHGARESVGDAGPGADARRVVRRVTEFLHERLGQTVRLAQLAEVAGMGPFALIRCFRRAVGVPPYAYLELLRVERAKELLRCGTAITEVAYATGFSDQSHLTRHFRRVVGVPPGRYARDHASSIARRVA
jgi:AraC-like DNA-binding protein